MSIDRLLDHSAAEGLKRIVQGRKEFATYVNVLQHGFREGDLVSITRTLEKLQSWHSEQQAVLLGLIDALQSFEVSRFLTEEFESSMRKACEEAGLELLGDFPNYVIFPFQLRVRPDKGIVEVDGKAWQCLRPQMLAAKLKAERDRLYKQPFDPHKFIDILAEVYDKLLALHRVRLKTEIQEDLSIPLREVYHSLTPLPAQRRAYPISLFAFHLHRLLVADVLITSDGRRMILESIRDRSKALVVYDAHGRSQRYGSLRFSRKEEMQEKEAESV